MGKKKTAKQKPLPVKKESIPAPKTSDEPSVDDKNLDTASLAEMDQAEEPAMLSEPTAEESAVPTHQAADQPTRKWPLLQVRERTLRQKGARGLALLIGLGFGSVALVGVMTGAVVYGHRAVELNDVSGQVHNQPFTLVFERPVKSSLSYTWREKIEGSWQTEKSLGGVKTLSFTPKTSFVPGARLHLDIDHIQPVINAWSGTPLRQTVQVDIQKAPGLKETAPKNGAQNVLVDSGLSVVLASKNHQLRRLQLVGDIPVVSKDPQTKDDITFRWKLASPLDQGREYKADIIDLNQTGEHQKVGSFDFQTVAEPQIRSGLSGFLRPGNKIAISFDQDIDQANAGIEFAMPGKGGWTGPRDYVFEAGAVEPGKAYSYKVLKGTKSTVGGFVIEEKVYTVNTPGPVTVIGARPTGTRVGLDAPISLTFNQPVDHASAEAAFSISPEVAGSFGWAGNTMTFRPAGYGYQTTYSYGVRAGIQPEFGLSGVGYTAQFTTAYEIKKLSVPFYRQVHALSCEAASLRMALAYHGVMTNDDEILGRIGYAPEPRNTETNTWQDPYQMFVGNVDGVMGKTGWGVYAPPVAKAARSFGRNAEVLNGPSSSQVAAAIYSGAPVVIWGVSAGAAPVADSWNTVSSGVVQAARNQHVRVVYGVEGSADNPVGFYINDPLRGSIYWSAGALQYNMNGGGAQALIVR